MNFKLLETIIIGLLLGMFFGSCKKSSSSSSSSGAAAGSCTPDISAGIGTVPSVSLALSCLSVPTKAVTVSSQSFSSTTPASNLDIDYSSLTQSGSCDVSPTFVMWKACTTDGKTCSNSGQFAQSYKFNIGNIPNLPKGTLNVSVALCVDSLQFLSASAQKTAKNQCTKGSPCYCGPVTTTQYINNDVSSNASPQFKAATTQYQADQQVLINLAKSYVQQAAAYVSQCKSSDSGKPAFQYATNISSMSGAELATYSESYGSYLAQVMSSASSGGFGLAAGTTSCSAQTTGTSTYMGTGTSSYMGTGAYTYGGTGTSVAGTTAPAGTVTMANSATNVADAINNNSPTGTATGTSTGKIVTISLGVIGILAGVAMITDFALQKSNNGTLWENVRLAGKALSIRGVRGSADSIAAARMVMGAALKTEHATLYEEYKAVYIQKLSEYSDELQTLSDKASSTEDKKSVQALITKLTAVQASAKALPVVSGEKFYAPNAAGSADISKPVAEPGKTKLPAVVSEGENTGKYLAGGLGVLAVGVLATVAGSEMNLVGQCGNFGAIVQKMESQLYAQGQAVQADIAAIEAIQGAQ